MNEKQKEAVNALNRLRGDMTEEEYFMLMDFITSPQVTYVPITPAPQPLEPFYDWKVTCGTTTTLQSPSVSTSGRRNTA